MTSVLLLADPRKGGSVAAVEQLAESKWCFAKAQRSGVAESISSARLAMLAMSAMSAMLPMATDTGLPVPIAR